MNSDSKRAVDQLRRRIKEVLQRSFGWVAWQRALEATFVDEYLSSQDRRATYCVDTSLIIEYLLPFPLKAISPDPANPDPDSNPSNYPRVLDLALLLLFDPAKPINILPPHRKEFDHKVREWQRQLAEQKAKLELFRSALDRLLTLIEANGEQEGDSDRFHHFINAVLSEESNFGPILALETRGERSVAKISKRLRPVAKESLATLVRDWGSSAVSDRIDGLYKSLSTLPHISRRGETSFSTRVDAHALYILEQENKLLPKDCYLILLTQSGKIWSFLTTEEQNQPLSFKNRRDKVWLIQTPEVALVSALVEVLRREAGEGEAGELEAGRELILDLEQNKRLRVIRDEIERKILPRLEDLVDDAERWQESEARVRELEDGLSKLKSEYQNRDRLRTLRLGMDVQESWGGALFQRLRSLQNTDQRELRSALSSELERLHDRVCNLEQQMLLASPPPPNDDAAFDLLGESSPELKGVVRSQAEGTAYFIRFQSPRILTHLEQIEDLLGQMDSKKGKERKEVFDQLQFAMRTAKRDSRQEPEYNLMLSAIYASRGLWFEAYVAADQGLKRLKEEALPEANGIRIEQVRFETQLIKGSALQHWALAMYGDLPQFAGQFLGEAAECVHKALAASVPDAIQWPFGSREDPRVLRELATIYGSAHEVEKFSRATGRLKEDESLISRDKMYFELAGLPAHEERSLLALYRVLAQKAYEGAVKVPTMRVYFVNSLLFALVEEDEEDSAQKDELAQELEELNKEQEHINSLDTLACFHLRRARRMKLQGEDFSAELQQAKQYLRRFRKKLQGPNSRQRFYKEMLRAREREMQALEPESGGEAPPK